MFRSKINPAELKAKKAKLFASLLKDNPEQEIFLAGEYSVPAPHIFNRNAKKKVQLQSHVVAYPSDQNPFERRFAVCDAKPIGKQDFLRTKFRSNTTIKVTAGKNGDFSVISKKKTKKRFVKLKELKYQEELENAEKENKILRSMSIFGAKQMARDGNVVAQVMHNLPGHDLIDVLIADGEEHCMFNDMQRLNLWIMAGEAIINQVHAKGIIHRDVKPDNLRVVLDEFNNPVSIIVIDFDLAKRKGQVVAHENVGTAKPVDYRSPEAKANKFTDEKTDAYSFAIMLMKCGWRNLFNEEKYTDLSFEQKTDLAQAVELGMHENAAQRASIQDIVDTMKTIRDELVAANQCRA